MENNQTPATDFMIISPVFREGSPIPPQYTCEGQNVNPPLNIFNAPDNAESLTLIMHDPDAPSGDYLHWLVYDIPPTTEAIQVNSVPVGALQGLNAAEEASYTGPCPPAGTGTHRYLFEAYALDTTLDLPAGADLAAVRQAMKGHILANATTTGTFAAVSA